MPRRKHGGGDAAILALLLLQAAAVATAAAPPPGGRNETRLDPAELARAQEERLELESRVSSLEGRLEMLEREVSRSRSSPTSSAGR